MVTKGELSKFAETTSVKGVSRLFKAESLDIRLLWVFAVVICLTLGCLNSYMILNDYLAYSPVSHVKAHSPRNQIFPNLMVCNLNPFVWLKDLPENQTYSFYIKMVHTKTKCDNCSIAEKKYLRLVRKEQLTISR